MVFRRTVQLEQSRRWFLSLVVIGVLAAAPATVLAQGRGVTRRDVEKSLSGATRMLATVGHWMAEADGGRFYFQFRSNGTYTYTHIDSDKVVRAQQAGGFSVRESRRVEAGWPRVAGGGEGGETTTSGRGLLLLVRPGSVTIQSSDPAELPGDAQAEFRLTFRYSADGTASTPSFDLLSAALPADSEFGRLRFTTGP